MDSYPRDEDAASHSVKRGYLSSSSASGPASVSSASSSTTLAPPPLTSPNQYTQQPQDASNTLFSANNNNNKDNNRARENGSSSSSITETTPLLINNNNNDNINDPTNQNENLTSSHRHKLPRGQIFLLCYARMTEPLAFFAIFPYVAHMVQINGHLASPDVGFYSGLVESVFSIAQTVSLLLWGRLADRAGRKPVLVWSLAGSALGPALFGFASSIPQMLAFRSVAGLFSGSALVVRTMMADLGGGPGDPDTQALAFGWFGFAGNVGILAGPVIGGLLAEPATSMPVFFEVDGFWARFPYALPGLAIATVVAGSAIACALFLQETLDRDEMKKKKTKKPSNSDDHDHSHHDHDHENNDDDDDDNNSTAKMTIPQLLRAPHVVPVLAIFSHVMLLALYTPIPLGGLAFSSPLISLYMALQGASQGLWLLLVFPALQRRLGTKRVLARCAAAYPFFFAGYPLLNALLRLGDAKPARLAFFALGSLFAIIGPAVSMAFTGAQLALQSVAPHPQLLGTLNALALTLASAIRSFAPGLSTIVYALGVRNHIWYGHLAWVILIALSAMLGPMLSWLPDDSPRSSSSC